MVDDLEVLVLGDDLHLLEVGAAGIEHDVRVEIEHLFQIGHGHVEQGADLGGQGLEEPDMGDGRGQFDMAHAFAAHLGGNDFNAALFADDAAVLHAFVLAAVAFVVLHRAEDLRAEQAVAFGLERTVVDGLRLLDFAVGPLPDLLRGSKPDAHRIKIIYIQQRDDTPFLFLIFSIIGRIYDRAEAADIGDDVIRLLVVGRSTLVVMICGISLCSGILALRRVDTCHRDRGYLLSH